MQNIDHVESMLEYWQQWRLQLQELFQEAQVGAVARADALMHYWQAVQPAGGLLQEPQVAFARGMHVECGALGLVSLMLRRPPMPRLHQLRLCPELLNLTGTPLGLPALQAANFSDPEKQSALFDQTREFVEVRGLLQASWVHC